MNASLVFDGGGLVLIPESMGTPTANQMVGTPLENLGECASRICYESLGLDENGKPRGRSSAKLHEHILEVRNHSVYEHANFTVRIDYRDPMSIASTCLNRKGVWVEMVHDHVEITTNFRAVLEWGRHTGNANAYSGYHDAVGELLRQYLRRLAPMIGRGLALTKCYITLGHSLKTDGLTDDQAWVSLWLYGSRGFTHEQVRHRFAMSQRSTRYVDEDGSPYITHPLVAKFLEDATVDPMDRDMIRDCIERSTSEDRNTYAFLVESLEEYGLKNGLDKHTSRKQARGAARGYLGNALASEMIYSAPVSGWKWILSQRKNRLADAEIRQVYTPALEALKASRYGDRFAQYETVPSPDGLGTVLA